MIIKNILNSDYKAICKVANWLWEEWGTSKNKKFWYSWVSSSARNDDIPQTFICIINEQIVGTVSLWRCDLQSRQDLFPWLGGLYIDEKYRNQGIAKQLIEHVCKVASNLGYTELFLFTSLENFYEKLDWKYLTNIPDENDNMVKLYRKELF